MDRGRRISVRARRLAIAVTVVTAVAAGLAMASPITAHAAQSPQLQSWSGSGSYDQAANTSQLTFDLHVLGPTLAPQENVQHALPVSDMSFLCNDPETGANGGSGGAVFGSEQAISSANGVTVYEVHFSANSSAGFIGTCRLVSALLVAQDGTQQEYPTEASLAGLGTPFTLQAGLTPTPTPTPTPSPSSLTLTATPLTQTLGQRVTLLATGVGAPGTAVRFGVTSGPDKQTFAAVKAADVSGSATVTMRGSATGVDKLSAWLDANTNGQIDPGEPAATTTVSWVPPTTVESSPHWAGYALYNPPVQPAYAKIVVPSLEQHGCLGPTYPSAVQYSSFWLGFNGARADTTYLPQIGLSAQCLPAGTTTTCSGKSGGADYYLWWEIDPHKAQGVDNEICGLPIAPGDEVALSVIPSDHGAVLTASVRHADGTTSQTWSHTFSVGRVKYDSLECVAEAPFLQGRPPPVGPLVNFGSVAFTKCSAIDRYTRGKSLHQINMQRSASVILAATSNVTVGQDGFGRFDVSWRRTSIG